MPRSERLIVGLGNPGAEYEGTRHNIGFMVVDALAERLGIDLEQQRNVLVGRGRHRGDAVGLAIPLTYVNRSGEAVRPLMTEHGLDAQDILVIVDDLNLPTGKVRLRGGGGSGGHNGLDDIAQRIGTTDFPRLRIGIGNDFGRGQQANYVLSPFSAQQQPLIDDAIIEACNAALAFVHDGVETAMNRFN